MIGPDVCSLRRRSRRRNKFQQLIKRNKLNTFAIGTLRISMVKQFRRSNNKN